MKQKDGNPFNEGVIFFMQNDQIDEDELSLINLHLGDVIAKITGMRSDEDY